jgi:hypothetical protein
VATPLSWTVLRRETATRLLAWSVEAPPPPPPEPKPPPVKRPPVRKPPAPPPVPAVIEPLFVGAPFEPVVESDDEDALAAILAALV